MVTLDVFRLQGGHQQFDEPVLVLLVGQEHLLFYHLLGSRWVLHQVNNLNVVRLRLGSPVPSSQCTPFP